MYLVKFGKNELPLKTKKNRGQRVAVLRGKSEMNCI